MKGDNLALFDVRPLNFIRILHGIYTHNTVEPLIKDTIQKNFSIQRTSFLAPIDDFQRDFNLLEEDT